MNKAHVGLILLMIAACTSEGLTQELRIASDATFAPFHLVDGAGRPTGFDIELARAVATKAGFEPVIVILPYDDLFSGLLAGTHDLVAATTGITPMRGKIYSFSQPYFKTCQVAVVRVGSAEPKAVSDLKGRRIGAAGSGTSALAMSVIDGVHTRIADGEGSGALLNNEIDAWVVDEFDAVGVVRASGDQLQVVPEGLAHEEYGFVLAKNRPELLAALNAGLRELEENGTIEKMRAVFGLVRDARWPVRCDGP